MGAADVLEEEQNEWNQEDKQKDYRKLGLAKAMIDDRTSVPSVPLEQRDISNLDILMAQQQELQKQQEREQIRQQKQR